MQCALLGHILQLCKVIGLSLKKEEPLRDIQTDGLMVMNEGDNYMPHQNFVCG